MTDLLRQLSKYILEPQIGPYTSHWKLKVAVSLACLALASLILSETNTAPLEDFHGLLTRSAPLKFIWTDAEACAVGFECVSKLFVVAVGRRSSWPNGCSPSV